MSGLNTCKISHDIVSLKLEPNHLYHILHFLANAIQQACCRIEWQIERAIIREREAAKRRMEKLANSAGCFSDGWSTRAKYTKIHQQLKQIPSHTKKKPFQHINTDKIAGTLFCIDHNLKKHFAPTDFILASRWPQSVIFTITTSCVWCGILVYVVIPTKIRNRRKQMMRGQRQNMLSSLCCRFCSWPMCAVYTQRCRNITFIAMCAVHQLCHSTEPKRKARL